MENSSRRHPAQDEAARHILVAPRHPAADARLAKLTASLAAIVRMLALAPSGACVVGAMTQLAHVLDHHLHAMRIAFRQMPARQIARQLAIDLEPSALDEIARLARTAKSVGLELDQRRERERVVARNEVDIAMRDAGHAEGALPSVIAGDVMQHGTRVVPLRILGHRARVSSHDEHGRMLEVICALARGHDDRRRHVGLLAAVEQAKWLHDPSRALMVLDCDRLVKARLWFWARL